jgi:small subunit ribosomal protein S15
MLSYEEKIKIINDFKISEKDKGSSDVQIALISKNISLLTEHLKKNKKDFHARKGLINMVNKRRKLLNYLKKNNSKRYMNIMKTLSIRHSIKQ